MKKIFLLMMLAPVMTAFSQQINVKSCIKVADGYYPVLNQDGSQLAFTTEVHKGLYVLDLTENKTSCISQNDICMETLFSKDNLHIFYRVRTLDANRVYNEVKSYNMTSAERQSLITRRRGVNALQAFDNGVLFSQQQQLRKSTFGRSTVPAESYVSNEDLKLVLYKNGQRIELNPYDEQLNYVWGALSPDGTKIVFNTVHGTAVCDLNGKLLCNLGKLNAPKWVDNETLVGMTDCSDGYYFTSSDIRIVSLDGKLDQMLTHEQGICMYPSVAGNHIAFNTLDGKIYMMEFEIVK